MALFCLWMGVEARGNKMMSLNEILEIENTPEIFEFSFQGHDCLMWPAIRHVTLRLIMDQEIHANGSLVQIDAPHSVNRRDQMRCGFDGLVNNMRFIKAQSDIVFFTSGVTNSKIDEKYVNRASDHFASCYPNSSLVFEDPWNWKYLTPRANTRIVYTSPIILTNSILSRFFSYRIKKKPILDFLDFINWRLLSILGYQLTFKQLDYLLNSLISHSTRIQYELWLYEKMFRKLDPKLILFEDGCYGGRGHLIQLAKRIGIKSAEIQHGMVSKGHNAYNFAPELLQSKQYYQYVPDYFLTYGEWWEERISIPCQTVTIGNAHRDYMLQRLNNSRKVSNIILILSGGLRFEFYVKMALSLVKLLPNFFEIVIRPHPGERIEIQESYCQDVQDVFIDYSDNIYPMLAKSMVVIGEVSTGLFEAVGLTNKIFTLQSPINSLMMPDNPFETVQTIEQLAKRLMERSSGVVENGLASGIWAEDWQTNYKNFIEREIGLNPD